MNATGIPPPTATTTTATSSSSPLAPVPPPTKKQRSTGETGYPDMDVATDAIAKRRAELRRLQRAQARPVGVAAAAASGGGKPPTGITDDLLARAKAETKGGGAVPPLSGGPPLAGRHGAAAANPFGAATSGFRGAGNLKPSKIPAPSPRSDGGEGLSADPPGASPTPPSLSPGERNVSGIRQSALYRNFAAERGRSGTAAPSGAPEGAPATAAAFDGGGGPPKGTDAGGVARRLDRTFRSTGGASAATGGGRAGVPTGGRVAEAPTFEERRTRSKSAPPRRPPPPTGGPPPQRSASRGKPRIPAAPRSGPPGATAAVPALSPESSSVAVGGAGKAALSPERSGTRRSERPRDTAGKLRERHGDVAPATPMPGSAVKKSGAKSSTRRKDALMALRDKALTPVKLQKATAPASSAPEEGKDAATVATEDLVVDGVGEEKKDGSHAPVDSPQKPVKTPQPPEEEVAVAGAAAGKKQREESNALRMMKELNAANDKAAKALMQVAKLEEELENLRRQKKDFGDDLGEMNGSSTPRRQGEPRSFFDVAREAGVATPAGLMSPYPHNGAPSPGLDGSPRRRAMSSGGISLGEADHVPLRKRTMTPQPRRKHRTSANRQDASTPAAEQIDVERRFFKAASLAVPEEYTSSLATYFVRRPYLDGKDDDASDADVQRRWDSHGSLPSSEYSGTADVSDPETIEVMATIVADESFLILSGSSKVRHGRTMGTTLSARDDLIEWRTFEDADCSEKPLGCVMYIDEYCNEREYWLDSIYEEALATREAYCSSLYSAASALQTTSASANENWVDMSATAAPVPVMPTNGTGGMDHMKVEEPQPDSKQIGTKMDEGSAVTRRKPAMADACVGTDPIVLPPRNEKPDMKQNQPKLPPSDNVEAKAPAQGKSTPPNQKEEEEAHINDILSSLIGFVLSTIFGAFWFMFIRLPLRILSWTLCIGMISVMLSVCWLYLADDHGAARIGAGIDYDYNRPGIF